MSNNKLIIASASLAGTIIGAGIFGVPFTFAKSGMLSGTILFVVLAVFLLFLHLMYGEVVDRTSEKHRLIGYSKKYFGNGARDLISASVIISIFGSLVVYLLLADSFLRVILPDMNHIIPFFWGLVFWILVSASIIKGMKTVARVEVLIVSALLLSLALIIFRGSPYLDVSNFTAVDWKEAFFPYGAIVFAIGGFAAIPEIHAMTSGRGKTFFRAIVLGFSLAAFATYLFTAVVVGISGVNTTPDAINGLIQYIGPAVVYIGAIFGLLTLSTSYMVYGLNIKESFMFDWKIDRWISDLLVVILPISIVYAGVTNFTYVISVTGAMLGAINGSMIALLFLKAKKLGDKEPSFSLKIPSVIVYMMITALILAGLYETINVIY